MGHLTTQPNLINSDFSILTPHQNVALNYINCSFYMLMRERM